MEMARANLNQRLILPSACGHGHGINRVMIDLIFLFLRCTLLMRNKLGFTSWLKAWIVSFLVLFQSTGKGRVSIITAAYSLIIT